MKNYILLIVFVFFLQKVNSQIHYTGQNLNMSVHYVRANVKTDSIVLLQPRVSVYTIETANKRTINYSSTEKALSTTNSVINEIIPDSIDTRFYKGDSLSEEKISKYLVKLDSKIHNSRQPKNIKIDKSIIKLFDSSAKYVMVMFVEGFTRDRDNLVNQAIGHKLSNFLWGTVSRPLAQNLMVGCCVIDVKKRRLVIYERNEWHEKDPNQEKNLTMALKQILNHHF